MGRDDDRTLVKSRIAWARVRECTRTLLIDREPRVILRVVDDRRELVVERGRLAWTPRPPHVDRFPRHGDFQEVPQASDGAGRGAIRGFRGDYGPSRRYR